MTQMIIQSKLVNYIQEKSKKFIALSRSGLEKNLGGVNFVKILPRPEKCFTHHLDLS